MILVGLQWENELRIGFSGVNIDRNNKYWVEDR